mgnify:CR=1 FL=1
MNILLSSHAFYPNIGGIETVSMLLAREFVSAGHDVIVVTQTPAGENDVMLPFKVVRRPSPSSLVRLLAWSEVLFQNNISLRTAWPLVFVPRPWVVVHHIYIPRNRGLSGFKGRLKHFVLHWATNIAVSQAVAKDFDLPVAVIQNPYDDGTFRMMPGIERTRDLIFVGRLIPDKGLPVLLEALKYLQEQGLKPGLTVVGEGPEAGKCRELTERWNLEDQVRFLGAKRGEELAAELNAHRIMVVPSVWNEPFGIVALEGMACGCVVVGSQGGGLPEAIGPGGLKFPNGDAHALAEQLYCLLENRELYTNLHNASANHLLQHQAKKIAADYLEILIKTIVKPSYQNNAI